eukprot:TRINITY_DN108_c1_g1_i2.p1 TRINITY_DN108_c1_g1~~TRINITY_DN108_c1_g1_i2.p1  ORF type:complete len:318 (-),score=94.13 TRINITY_DN108_c1_g1_i2:563-1516(-)
MDESVDKIVEATLWDGKRLYEVLDSLQVRKDLIVEVKCSTIGIEFCSSSSDGSIEVVANVRAAFFRDYHVHFSSSSSSPSAATLPSCTFFVSVSDLLYGLGLFKGAGLRIVYPVGDAQLSLSATIEASASTVGPGMNGRAGGSSTDTSFSSHCLLRTMESIHVERVPFLAGSIIAELRIQSGSLKEAVHELEAFDDPVRIHLSQSDPPFQIHAATSGVSCEVSLSSGTNSVISVSCPNDETLEYHVVDILALKRMLSLHPIARVRVNDVNVLNVQSLLEKDGCSVDVYILPMQRPEDEDEEDEDEEDDVLQGESQEE